MPMLRPQRTKLWNRTTGAGRTNLATKLKADAFFVEPENINYRLIKKNNETSQRAGHDTLA
jgi:hypothetical protein